VTPPRDINSTADPSALVEAAVDRLRDAGAGEVEAGLILGSGLSYLADDVDDRIAVGYDEIPGFPRSTVEGHSGNFVVGTLDTVPVAFAQGRFHLYEGYPPAWLALPVRVLAALGARFLLVTNAAGSLGPDNAPGTLLAITDHINFQFANPLIGRPASEITNPFPDMCNAYDEELRERLTTIALEQETPLHEGVYAGVLGPSYETAAEIGLLRKIGAHAVGMSTVAEVIAAAELGLPVVGVSLLTNYATGLTAEHLDHDEVTEAAASARPQFERLVRAFVRSATSRSQTA
jgi:purine-nucleoside phosphorylase